MFNYYYYFPINDFEFFNRPGPVFDVKPHPVFAIKCGKHIQWKIAKT